ncbi:MAG TPA: hypothetical protein VE990_14610 [Acidimicrobiales bacterium]|nr:hypothetical protein [Acidimicrobiales bacterium]
MVVALGPVGADLAVAAPAEDRSDADPRSAWLERLRSVVASSGLAPDPQANLVVHCPVDDWGFRPYYSDGRCPLCGYIPEGEIRTLTRQAVDWFWPAVGLTALMSVIMGVLVVLAYLRA